VLLLLTLRGNLGCRLHNGVLVEVVLADISQHLGRIALGLELLTSADLGCATAKNARPIGPALASGGRSGPMEPLHGSFQIAALLRNASSFKRHYDVIVIFWACFWDRVITHGDTSHLGACWRPWEVFETPRVFGSSSRMVQAPLPAPTG
jgi:hypothetical protein